MKIYHNKLLLACIIGATTSLCVAATENVTPKVTVPSATSVVTTSAAATALSAMPNGEELFSIAVNINSAQCLSVTNNTTENGTAATNGHFQLVHSGAGTDDADRIDYSISCTSISDTAGVAVTPATLANDSATLLDRAADDTPISGETITCTIVDEDGLDLAGHTPGEFTDTLTVTYNTNAAC